MTTTVTKEVGELLESLVDAWNRHDPQAYAGYWTEDADFVNVLGMRRYNRAELLAEISWLHAARFAGTQIRTLSHSERLVAPDVAVIHQHWEMTGDPGQPEYPVKDGLRRGILIHVAQRTLEGWRLVASQNTDTLPVPDPLRN